MITISVWYPSLHNLWDHWKLGFIRMGNCVCLIYSQQPYNQLLFDEQGSIPLLDPQVLLRVIGPFLNEVS